MTTFSQLVDKMVLETKRPDLRGEIASYLNQTLRELHMEPSRGAAVFYQENMKEDQLTIDVETGFYWEVPNPGVFQALSAVRYDTVWNHANQVWAKMVNPGKRFEDEVYTFYRSGNNVYFRGHDKIGGTITIAWYEFTKSLKYYDLTTRPASYDLVDGWTYLTAATPEDELAARESVTNWLLFRWSEVIEEGLRAKVYKRLSDTERARTSYSMYSTLRQGLYSSEVAELGMQ